MKQGAAPKVIKRKDYMPYPWLLEKVNLNFAIGEKITTVSTVMDFTAVDPNAGEEIVLNGNDLSLLSVSLNGRLLQTGEYSTDDDFLIIHQPPARCRLEIEVNILPFENTALEGLYPSGDFLLTQCEAEGFRKITYFPDRPDVMTSYEVTMTADRSRFPVLLSNGNAADSGELEDGRHWVRWVDPHRKPSYLFAVVAGDLEYIEDRFTTRGGRDVVLRVYVEKQNLDKCDHAMRSLINSMKWDEDRFDLEYDLDIYNIVATDDFNMGAMENKSLNIFNSKYVLGKPETATDGDFQAIEGVIGHEYFHNWTGNRVTCRDWFQLTLKEGLTVFRDQEFSSDMQSRAVNRIRDVRDLRNRQFPEDSGPMSHPIRPDQFVEINNFYTMTVYQKGATIIRMYHTLLGEEGFQKGMKLYFERHDGEAVTCDDFLAAMSDANGRDLGDFAKWYGQSGTPEVTARTEYDEETARFTLHLSQHTPPTHDQPVKQALLIPFAFGLLTSEGEQIKLQSKGDPAEFTRLLILDQEQQSFVFEQVASKPIPALLRDFSAPIKLHYEYETTELVVLMKHDPDPFLCWEAAQLLAQNEILENCKRHANEQEMGLKSALIDAFSSLLNDPDGDPGLIAEAMQLPSEDYLSEQMQPIDVDGIHAARKFTKQALAQALQNELESTYHRLNLEQAYDISADSMARRSLKNQCLSYLVELPVGQEMAEKQLADSNNMTDTLAALSGLLFSAAPSSEQAMSLFESNWKHDPLVMDKWFSLYAVRPGPDTVNQVAALMKNPAFSMSNPNKVRSLLGAFSMANPTGFHARSGEGYRFVADRLIELDRLNPQVAARITSCFNRWKRYDTARQSLMQAELQRIADTPGLSSDVAEIVGNALK